MTRAHRPSTYFLVMLLMTAWVNASAQHNRIEKGWWGHPFVFCFISDDGTLSNLGWAEQALADDFRFTIALSADFLDHPRTISRQDAEWLAAQGFEIACHTSTHCSAGMTPCINGIVPPDCDPSFGELRGYFDDQGSFSDPQDAMPFFSHEIDRAYLASFVPGLDIGDVRTLAYPRHGHGMAITDSLMARGYLGAHASLGVMSSHYSDYVTEPHNSWSDGISLYRVPVTMFCSTVFGDHSAEPPVHHDHATFVAEAQPFINEVRASGGILAITTHTYGDDDTTWDGRDRQGRSVGAGTFVVVIRFEDERDSRAITLLK